MNYANDHIRNVLIAGHGGAGKTSLAEALLFTAKSTDRLGRVEDGNTVCDYDPEEAKRRASLSLAVAPVEYDGVKINLIDTPGLFDFELGLHEGIRAAESVLITVSGRSGLTVGAQKAYKLALKHGKSRMIYISKIDAEHADFYKVFEELKAEFGPSICPVVVPIEQAGGRVFVNLIESKAYSYVNGTAREVPMPKYGHREDGLIEAMREAVAETDDALMEKFFEDPDSITPDELLAAIRKATISMQLVPMLCGSSFHNKGVQKLLDYVMAFLPSPLDVPAVRGINPKTDAEEVRHASVEDPFCGLAFKIATDPFVGRLCFVRVYSGKLDAGSYVLNSRSGKRERISRLYQMHSNKQNPLEVVEAGDICAAVGFKEIRTGDTLCAEDAPIVLEQMTFPEPVIGLAVEPKTQKDLDKLGIALGKLAEEDPTFTVHTDEDSGQTVISGMGELHLDIIVDRLRREFGVEINQGAPQVNYKEALTKTVQHREVFKKQTGGRGKFADIIFEIGPADEGTMGLTFVDEVKGGNIPKEFIPAVQKGFAAAMANGALAGYTMDSMKVTLKDGSFHPVDSDQLSFEICARNGYRNAAPKAGSVIKEPIMSVEVVTPEENMGDIIGDLNKRRGQVTGMESKGNARVVKAKVPLSEMFGYVTVLRTISSGRATSSMEFSHFEEVPANIAKEVIEKASGKRKELE